MSISPKPEAPNSTSPQGPVAAANKLYPRHVQAVQPPGDKSDAWRGGAAQTAGNGAVATKGAVPVSQAKELPGDQGTKNSHTKPGAIKPVGPADALRKTGSVTTQATLSKGKSQASRIYPNLKEA